MPNKIKIIIFVIAILTIVFFITSLVWGKTVRMAKANQLFSKSQVDKAKVIYEDLAVDLPKSPYVLHNIGLSYFKQGENDRAVEYFQNSLKEFESIKQNPVRKKDALNLDYYHLGGAQFQSAAKNTQGQSGANLYQEALDNFQKAVENNPKDLDAKYNYELTKLRLQSKDQQQSQNQNKKDQEQNQNQKQKQNQQENKSDNKNQNKNAKQEESNPKPTQSKDQMSKEEVESLLKMTENNDQYQTPVINDSNQSPEKNW